VLTLWAAVVAERLGFDRDEALTIRCVVAGLNAYSKGKSFGIFRPAPETVEREQERLAKGKAMTIELLHRAVPAVRTPEGLRALSRVSPVSPASVECYLAATFGTALGAVEAAMRSLARSLPPEELAGRAYALYETFRPAVPAGTRSWGWRGCAYPHGGAGRPSRRLIACPRGASRHGLGARWRVAAAPPGAS